MGQRCYLVCATPRSGSTLLCELLKDCGVAGRPEEYFEARADTGRPAHPGDYLEGLPRTGAGIRDDMRPPAAPPHSSLIGVADYRQHLARTFSLGTGPNGVFGAKVMWRHLPHLHALADQLPEFRDLSLPELLTRLFDDPSYVWVTRRDKVRQAVSLWRALQTRAWRRENGSGGDRPVELHYRFEGIDHLVRRLEADDSEWQEFFERSGLSVLRVGYEEHLERDPAATISSVLSYVGVDAPEGWSPRPALERQADALSDEWAAAYHRDAAARAAVA